MHRMWVSFHPKLLVLNMVVDGLDPGTGRWKSVGSCREILTTGRLRPGPEKEVSRACGRRECGEVVIISKLLPGTNQAEEKKKTGTSMAVESLMDDGNA